MNLIFWARAKRVFPVPQLQPLDARKIKRGPFLDKKSCMHCATIATIAANDRWKQVHMAYCIKNNLPSLLSFAPCPICDDVPDMIDFSDDE
jgi:hypothetical protein